MSRPARSVVDPYGLILTHVSLCFDMLFMIFTNILTILTTLMTLWQWMVQQLGLSNTESHPTPRRRGLLIGINHSRTDSDSTPLSSGPYRDTHKDVEAWKNLLISSYSYEEDELVSMIDHESCKPELRPTRCNVLTRLRLMTQDARKGDRFFFLYAGHSSLSPSSTGLDDADRRLANKLWCSDGLPIRDKELRYSLLGKLPAGAKLTAVVDSCHSASFFGLEHGNCHLLAQALRKLRPMVAPLRQCTLKVLTGQHSPPVNTSPVLMSPDSPSPLASRQNSYEYPHQLCAGLCAPSKSRLPDVLSIAACGDRQETYSDDNGGCLTRSLTAILRHNPHPTLAELNEWLYSSLRRENEIDGRPIRQKPQLRSMKPLNFDLTRFTV
ncbi:hypothetical protein PUNSTDRAFT_143880 [Punctularia strigosozonata HHB-11173 SS5]|uniref:uncharacterized protein n=1 Tax=Punctularia strigosozonata (strain HHB-11173) TaxID=741275 RepID=UPI0004418061|nr:uncharacterized protein PUNSTDRAFT_143880 [Punctularia strigosozonata HHB-11173 SS5]EIN08234.1 hypothetical protein PUNSTDRAFT_143880 [Punctularia strigosozonata HHB-11173 SS5]